MTAHMMSADVDALANGLPPPDSETLERLSVGIDYITDFWVDEYLDKYISLGGSKIKFITGGAGSGKTHCLRLFLADAEQRGYKTALISADEVWISDFKEIYAAVLAAVDLPGCLERCAMWIVGEMGYGAGDIPEGSTFADYLSSLGRFDPLTRRELRERIVEYFLKNPRIDNNFALACSIITGDMLGYPTLDASGREILSDWLAGVKGVRMAAVRKLGLSPVKITKYNARHMLRSLVEIVRSAGYAGLVVGADKLDELLCAPESARLRYTKLRREDAYESIRELIDDIDTQSHTMFIFAFDRALIDDESAGLKSYQALWMRIQNEIDGALFNRFADIVDLDGLARQTYAPGTLVEMSRRLAAFMREQGVPAEDIDLSLAEELREQSSVSPLSLPRRVNRLTLLNSFGGVLNEAADEAEAIPNEAAPNGGTPDE